MNKFIKSVQDKFKKIFQKLDTNFDLFQKTAIGKFIIERLVLRTKTFYSVLSFFGSILVAQISAYNNIMQWSSKVNEQLNNSEGWAYVGWFILSFFVPDGNMAVIVALILIILAAFVIRYKEISQNVEYRVIKSRTNAILCSIKENSKFYVETENHHKAIEKLEKSNIIIIAGEPGVGKTTLAENLVLYYVQKGFKFYYIANSIEEEFGIIEKNEKQIFYFDDFLGDVYLNAIENKHASHVIKFMNIIRANKNKKFILTSRTNIFNKGLALSDTLKSKNIENEEFIIRIRDLSDIDKAKILYNHINFGDLSKELINEICRDERYRKIIKHQNFNPRLIAFITDIQKIQKEQIEAKDYWNYIIDKLNNPQDIWKNTFDIQSDEFTRVIVMLTVFNGNKIEENQLRDSYYRYIDLTRLINISNTSKDFDSIIEEVVKYFLNRNQMFLKKIEYSLFNPSIADFVLNKYKNNLTILKNIYKALESHNALSTLLSLKRNKVIKDKYYLTVLDELLREASLQKNVNYIIKLSSLVNNISASKINKELLKTIIQKVIDGEVTTRFVEELSKLINLFDICEFNINDFDFFHDLIEYTSEDISEINSVIRLYDYFNIKDKDIDNELNELITKYFEKELSDYADSIYESDVEFEECMNDDDYFEVVDGEIEKLIDDQYDELKSSLDHFEGYDIDEDKIKNTIDIDQIKDRLSSDYTSEKFDNYMREDDDNNTSSYVKKDDIESMFNKLRMDNK